MKINPVICTQCGASINVDSFPLVFNCNYCGTSFFANYGGTTSNNEKFFDKDSPINISVSQIDQPIINLDYISVLFDANQINPDRSRRVSVSSTFKAAQKKLELLSVLSYCQNRDYICSVSYSYYELYYPKSMRIVHTTGYFANIQKTVESQLNKWGFCIQKALIDDSTYKSKNDERKKCFVSGKLLISPSSRDTLWNDKLYNIVQKLRTNPIILHISDCICNSLSQMEHQHVEKKKEGICRVQVSADDSGICYPGGRFVFHELGYNNLTTDELKDAFLICVLSAIIDKLGDRWLLREISDFSFELFLKYKFEKHYNDWL